MATSTAVRNSSRSHRGRRLQWRSHSERVRADPGMYNTYIMLSSALTISLEHMVRSFFLLHDQSNSDKILQGNVA